MEKFIRHHLRVVVALLILLPTAILFLNAFFMHSYLTVTRDSSSKVHNPLSEKLQNELLKYRWLNAAQRDRERLMKKDIKRAVRNGNQTEISVTFFVKFAYKRMKILRNMARCLGSILKRTEAKLHFHILLDLPSGIRVNRTMMKIATDTKKHFKVSYHNVDPIFHQFRDTITMFRKYFFTKDVGRYSDDLFFVSQMFHKAKPFLNLKQLIMLDLDTKFQTDIAELVKEYDKFDKHQIMAIAHDQQPQYRFDFAKYRFKNPGTKVGSPNPGQQGFNTGIVLFNLKAMRESLIYNDMLKEDNVNRLCKKYDFRGYMGHQDFYTLSGMEHPELYRVLDCTWNRQLDTGWNKAAGIQVFQQYHNCTGKVKVYHGNGGAFIPET